MKKLMLIANPHSGKGHAKPALFDVISLFNNAGYTVTVFTPDKDTGRSIQSTVREFASDYDAVVCMGGDGTLSDTANGLMECSVIPPVGYIPTGSTNDMASSLTLPKSPVAAAKSIIDGAPVPFDMGYYDGKYFTYIAAFGAFTSVSYMTPQKLKNTFGHLAYIFEGIGHLPSIKPVRTVVEYDDGTIEGNFVFGCVANSTSVAGLVKLDPTMVSLSDGLFEIILVKEPLSLADMGNILNDIIYSSFESDNVVLLHSSKVKFTFDTPVPWTRDGESGGTYSEISIENKHKALNIIRQEA